jgi:hypothetical protein
MKSLQAYSVVLLVASLLFLTGGGICRAQTDPAPPPLPEPKDNITNDIRNDKPSFLVRVSVDRRSHSYREGDTLQLEVQSERDAYVYVLYQPAKGKVYKIFPNSVQSNNFVKAKQVIQIPEEGDLFRWVVSAPFGKEYIKVIATEKPVKEFSTPELKQKRFNSVSRDLVKGVAKQLKGTKGIAWAESDVEIYTYARNESARIAGTHRYGVFFGISKFKYNSLVQKFSEGEISLNLPSGAADALVLADLFAKEGRLDQQREFTDEQATKRNMELAVTEWLPSISRPGDTVFLFFSTHGTQIQDDSGDEQDKLDEALLPHDFIGPSILAELHKRAKEGKTVDPRYRRLLDIARAAGDDSKQMYADLVRETCVSADLFARWLQRLDGRKVVVIMHTCHSGGFATIEKNLVSNPQFEFDFLDNEFSRLKDIGQSNQALFAASMASQFSAYLGRQGMKLSVMPHFLALTLQQQGGPVTLQNSFATCKAEMKRFFDTLDPVAKKKLDELVRKAGSRVGFAQDPYLINNISGDVYLRP